jgi:hypothetical protein
VTFPPTIPPIFYIHGNSTFINFLLRSVKDLIFFLERMGIIPIYRSIGNFGKTILTKKLINLGSPKNACVYWYLTEKSRVSNFYHQNPMIQTRLSNQPNSITTLQYCDN